MTFFREHTHIITITTELTDCVNVVVTLVPILETVVQSSSAPAIAGRDFRIIYALIP